VAKGGTVHRLVELESESVQCESCGDHIPTYDPTLGCPECSRCWTDRKAEEDREDRIFYKEQKEKWLKSQKSLWWREDVSGLTFEEIIARFWRLYHGRPEPGSPSQVPKRKRSNQGKVS
jgi:hypothetical protein